MAEPGRTEPTPSPRAQSRGAVVAVVATVALLGVGAWLALKRSTPKPLEAPAPVAAAPASSPSLPPRSVADDDATFRRLAASLGAESALAAWLTQGHLVQRLTAAVNLVADGDSPRAVLEALAPSRPFAAATVNGRLATTPESYARYDAVVKAAAALDPVKAAGAYAELRPAFRAAFAAIGEPGASFDRTLRAALDRLLATPVPAAEPELVPRTVGYAFADPALESLSGAQKLLLRTGPANQRAFQAWLRALESALPPPGS